MSTIFDKNPQEVIDKASEGLKPIISMPEWAKFIKTAPGKEKHPTSPDWFFHRAASILRKVYIKGPIGTSKLKKNYSFKQNRGHKPEKRRFASQKIIRNILQQLEKAEFLKQEEKGSHKGRIISPKGKSFLNKCTK